MQCLTCSDLLPPLCALGSHPQGSLKRTRTFYLTPRGRYLHSKCFRESESFTFYTHLRAQSNACRCRRCVHVYCPSSQLTPRLALALTPPPATTPTHYTLCNMYYALRTMIRTTIYLLSICRSFMRSIFLRAQIEDECVITSLIYLERLLKVSGE
jgi:hypothetical protein